MRYYVYILASATNVTLYIGVTSNLLQRIYQHRNHIEPDSFTAKYHVHKLVYFEETSDVRAALEREKQLKGWRRSKKNWLVERQNPNWIDLYPHLLGEGTDSSTPLRLRFTSLRVAQNDTGGTDSSTPLRLRFTSLRVARDDRGVCVSGLLGMTYNGARDDTGSINSYILPLGFI